MKEKVKVYLLVLGLIGAGAGELLVGFLLASILPFWAGILVMEVISGKLASVALAFKNKDLGYVGFIVTLAIFTAGLALLGHIVFMLPALAGTIFLIWSFMCGD